MLLVSMAQGLYAVVILGSRKGGMLLLSMVEGLYAVV